MLGIVLSQVPHTVPRALRNEEKKRKGRTFFFELFFISQSTPVHRFVKDALFDLHQFTTTQHFVGTEFSTEKRDHVLFGADRGVRGQTFHHDRVILNRTIVKVLLCHE